MAEYCKNCKNMTDEITELHKQGNALLLEAAKDGQEIARLGNVISTCIGIIRASEQVTQLLADKLEAVLKDGDQ